VTNCDHIYHTQNVASRVSQKIYSQWSHYVITAQLPSLFTLIKNLHTDNALIISAYQDESCVVNRPRQCKKSFMQFAGTTIKLCAVKLSYDYYKWLVVLYVSIEQIV